MSCSVRQTTRYRCYIHTNNLNNIFNVDLAIAFFIQTKHCQDIKISCLLYFNSFLNICIHTLFGTGKTLRNACLRNGKHIVEDWRVYYNINTNLTLLGYLSIMLKYNFVFIITKFRNEIMSITYTNTKTFTQRCPLGHFLLSMMTILYKRISN